MLEKIVYCLACLRIDYNLYSSLRVQTMLTIDIYRQSIHIAGDVAR